MKGESGMDVPSGIFGEDYKKSKMELVLDEPFRRTRQ